jgi:uncharacterized FAD-dependent dehydrogenase
VNEIIQLLVDPEFVNNPAKIKQLLTQKALGPFDGFKVVRRSVDARSKRPRFNISVALTHNDDPGSSDKKLYWDPVSGSVTAIVIGSGPAGLFSALTLIENGIRPIILERGRPSSRRRKDIASLLRSGDVDPVSNYCFGEGGAGTFSDGKLYTRSTKRGNVEDILEILIFHGAQSDIRIDARPHIGSNRLPAIVENIRQTIIRCGGEFHFESCVSGFHVDNNRLRGVRTLDGEEYSADAVILATGHSARDIYSLFRANSLAVYPKSLAVGVRIEHPQELIDTIQYHAPKRHPNLPPAEYRFVSNIESRGVYSFCMCPGGHIIPASTCPGELVVNGMSNASRNSPFANSGIVVEVRWEDIEPFHSDGPYAFLSFQEEMERRAYNLAGGSGQQAPAQRLTDFLSERASSILPKSSYLPGTSSVSLWELFPPDISRRLRGGFEDFGNKRKGFISDEALLIGVESRTSAPLTIPRDSRSLMHPQLNGLFPCGEGAGHAGGIVSSAMDGRRVALAAACHVKGDTID